MHRKRMLFGAAAILLCVAVTRAGPNRYGHSDRVERHMLPAVSTGPLDPAWSPDGQWIAFSMRGDIWKVPARRNCDSAFERRRPEAARPEPRAPVLCGEAVALTHGPAYHFEPAWSPDGRSIALSMDTDGNLDIGVVDAAGGDVRRITTDSAVDVEPEWTADGRRVLFVSARSRGFRIFSHDLATGVDSELVAGFQPAVSPDGKQLAYVASVRGRLGTGGIWLRDLPDGEPRLVRYEESEYRMKPAWTPDGTGLLYVSDERGSNDVAIVPAAGGNPIVLTDDDAHDEYAPVPSPDGTRFAFVSNAAGATTLYTADAAGGRPVAWHAVPITSRRSAVPTGRLRIRVVGPDGQLVPARVLLRASDSRSYAPDGGFHRVSAATETHYFHMTGEAEVEVPAGRTEVEALRGFEYRPSSQTIDVLAGGAVTMTLALERLMDLPARGWYSGDTHIHDLHQGRFGLTHEAFFDQLRAEDLHVTNALIHMDGTRLMGRWADLTGAVHPLSTVDYILRYGEEFRGSLGHIELAGVKMFVLPLTAGVQGTAYAQPTLDDGYIDRAHAQGGIAGFAHPFFSPVEEPADAAGSLIPLDVALGKGDYYEIASLWSDEIGSAELYYRILNCGFRLPVSGGTDNFSDVWRDPPPGTDRTFVHIDGPLTYAKWLDALRAGHTFASTGPLLFLDVAGHEPGDEIALGDGDGAELRVRAEATSIAPMERIEIIVNGEIAGSTQAGDSSHVAYEGGVSLPAGGWIAARVVGPASKYVGDSYAFAHTSPVYVVRDGRAFTSAEDARFLGAAVEALWARVQRAPWRSPAERDRFSAAVDRAVGKYRSIAEAAAHE